MKEIRLIAADMDHTLLTEAGEFPPGFFDTVLKLNQLGVDFVIASGRPLYTLESLFTKVQGVISYIADNGGVIQYKGKRIFSNLLEKTAIKDLIRFSKSLSQGIPVLCGLQCAYIEAKHRIHDPLLSTFYTKITYVDDLLTIDCDADKFTIYYPDKNAKEQCEVHYLPRFHNQFAVTLGDVIWIDITNPGVNKGQAMDFLKKSLNITRANMMAFGDTFNDKEMLEAVDYSYLVANATPEMFAYARYKCPSNEEYGVMQILDQVIAAKTRL
ncbi:MAG: HAD family hydrolase [Erysipelotrichaceae bacterium]|nr:HAD family hydrolase [Erysipelotrichaceae bacterium]